MYLTEIHFWICIIIRIHNGTVEFEWNLIKRITIYAPRVLPINVTRRPDTSEIRWTRGGETSPGESSSGYSREKITSLTKEAARGRVERSGWVSPRGFRVTKPSCTPPAYVPPYSYSARGDLPRKFKGSLSNVVPSSLHLQPTQNETCVMRLRRDEIVPMAL